MINRYNITVGVLIVIGGFISTIPTCKNEKASKALTKKTLDQVSQEDTMNTEIIVIEYKLTPRTAKEWWLSVVWRFRNSDSRPLYLLVKGPHLIIDGHPLVLDHSISDDTFTISPYDDPEMKFATVEGRGFLDFRHNYPLPPIDSQKLRAVIGRFSYSYERPDPKWCDGHVWDAVKKWQQIIESSQFEIKFPKH